RMALDPVLLVWGRGRRGRDRRNHERGREQQGQGDREGRQAALLRTKSHRSFSFHGLTRGHCNSTPLSPDGNQWALKSGARRNIACIIISAAEPTWLTQDRQEWLRSERRLPLLCLRGRIRERF